MTVLTFTRTEVPRCFERPKWQQRGLTTSKNQRLSDKFTECLPIQVHPG